MIEFRQRIQGMYANRSQQPISRLTLSILNRAKDAVASTIKRLAHRNANVQLYTLEVGCLLREKSAEADD